MRKCCPDERTPADRAFSQCPHKISAAVLTAAELKGRAFGGGAIGDLGVTAAHLDLIERTMVLVLAVIGAACHRTGDAGIGISVFHRT